MADKTWEDRCSPDDPGLVDFDALIQPDEVAVATALMSHVRHLATYRTTDTTPEMLVADKWGYYPEDARPISPSHSVGYLTIEHRETYWAAFYGSREFSSSFGVEGRGRTLAEALADLTTKG